MRIDRTLLAVCLLLLVPVAHAGEAATLEGLDGVLAGGQAEEKLDELEPVVIVGGFATPKMWKVSKGDHVLWVLGGEAIPPGVQWRFEQVDARIAESQLVLYPGLATVDMDVGFFRIVTLVPTAFKTAKIPDGKTLKDVLPPDLYARWRVLKTTYEGKDNDIEKWRPGVAIIMLHAKTLKKIGPVQARPPTTPPPARPRLRPLVDKSVKQHKVKVRTLRTVEREYKVKNVKERLKSLRESPAWEVKCFAQALDQLEHLVEYANRKKAAGTQDIGEPPPSVHCDDSLIKGMRSGEIPDPAGILKLIDEIAMESKLAIDQRDAEWIAAAQTAIATNKSTFTLLAMYQIKSPTGYVAKLKELGYTVEEPD
ncbi:MAG: TraB/GumN family protein [Steroidobacteraceae bacterium]